MRLQGAFDVHMPQAIITRLFSLYQLYKHFALGCRAYKSDTNLIDML